MSRNWRTELQQGADTQHTVALTWQEARAVLFALDNATRGMDLWVDHGQHQELRAVRAEQRRDVLADALEEAVAKVARVREVVADIERQSRICNVGNTATIATRLRAALDTPATEGGES